MWKGQTGRNRCLKIYKPEHKRDEQKSSLNFHIVDYNFQTLQNATRWKVTINIKFIDFFANKIITDVSLLRIILKAGEMHSFKMRGHVVKGKGVSGSFRVSEFQ